MGFLLAALAGGCLALPFLPWLPPPWLVPLLALLAALGWLRWRRRAWLGACLFCLALAWSVLAAGQALSQWLPSAWEGRPIQAEGYVEGLPTPAMRQGQHLRFRPLRLAVEEGQAQVVEGRWQLYLPSPDALEPGSHCRLSVRLKRPHGPANAGGFDYEAWLLSEGVTATGSIRTLHCRPPATASVDGLRLRLRTALLQAFPDRPAAGVLLALISGDRAFVSPVAWERYAATGIVHLMAISGLHIGMVAAVAAWLLLRLLRRWPRLALQCPLHKPALLGGFAVAFGYSLLAGFSIPTERTLFMLGMVVLAACSERRLPAMQVLLLALVAVLLWSPLAVHAAGFWLSFAAVAVLVLLASSSRGQPAWRQALQLQLALSLLLTPLTLWFFERLSWVSPLANLLAVPLVTFLVVPLGLLGFLCWLSGQLAAAQLLWGMAIRLLEWLDVVLAQLASWPGASLGLGLPGPTGLLWLLLALLCLVQPLSKGLRLLAPVFLLPLFLPAPLLAPGQLRVTVLDVGQGLSVLVETAGHRLLYDAGPALGPQADAGRRYVLPTLYRQGIHRLDRLLLSHDDSDHTGGAASVLAAVAVGAGQGAHPAWLRLPAALRWQDCRAGQRWQWDGWEFAVLYPDAMQARFATNDNNRSCVLRISRGHAALLLTGDLERLGELSLLEKIPAAELRADVLVLGHHGSRSSSSEAFLAAVQPRLALASAGYRNSFHHPSKVVLQRLQQANIPWRNTAESGALTLLLDDGGILALHEFRPESGRYWQADKSTAFFANPAAASALGAMGVNR